MSVVVSFNEFACRAIRRKQQIPYIESSKGYPALRDPAADNPIGALQSNLDEASLHKLRQHYGPAFVFTPESSL
jgi:hypothetical protein